MHALLLVFRASSGKGVFSDTGTSLFGYTYCFRGGTFRIHTFFSRGDSSDTRIWGLKGGLFGYTEGAFGMHVAVGVAVWGLRVKNATVAVGAVCENCFNIGSQ